MEGKWFAIMLIGVGLVMGLPSMVVKYANAQVSIACYNAQSAAIKANVPFDGKCGVL